MDVRNKYKLHKKDSMKQNSTISEQQKDELDKLMYNFYAKLLSDLKQKYKIMKYIRKQISNYEIMLDFNTFII